MRKASLSDMNLVADLIVRMFDSNPGVNLLIRQGVSKQEAIWKLAEFAFIKCVLRNGVFISTNEKGAVLSV